MSAANGSYSRINVLVGSDWQVRCLPVPTRIAVLDIDAGDTQIPASIAGPDIRASGGGPHHPALSQPGLAQSGRDRRPDWLGPGGAPAGMAGAVRLFRGGAGAE